MIVDRCVCHGVTLSELKGEIARTGGGLHELRARTGCTTGCGLCEPYILVMLKTGLTRVPVMTPAEIAALLARAGDQRSRPDSGGSDSI